MIQKYLKKINLKKKKNPLIQSAVVLIKKLKFVPIYSPWRSHWRTIPPSTPVTKEGAGRHRDATTEEIGSQYVRIINFPFKYIQLVLLNLCNIHKWKEKKIAEKRFYIIKNHLNLIFWQYKICSPQNNVLHGILKKLPRKY